MAILVRVEARSIAALQVPVRASVDVTGARKSTLRCEYGLDILALLESRGPWLLRLDSSLLPGQQGNRMDG
jgi:hypothetical protein